MAVLERLFLPKYSTTLTDHLQQGGGHQAAVPIFDLVHAVVPRGQPRDDHLVDGAVPAQWDQAPITQVVIRYLALAHQLHRATGRLGIKRSEGGFVGVAFGGENEMRVWNGEKKGKV